MDWERGGGWGASELEWGTCLSKSRRAPSSKVQELCMELRLFDV